MSKTICEFVGHQASLLPTHDIFIDPLRSVGIPSLSIIDQDHSHEMTIPQIEPISLVPYD